MQGQENQNQSLINLENENNSPSNTLHPQNLVDLDANSEINIQTNSKKNASVTIKSIKVRAERISSQGQKIIKQCRICLQGQEEGRMVQPCLCSGSVTFAHQKCIIEWIKRKHEIKSKGKLSCQMCHAPFAYKFGKSRKLDMQQFCANYQKQKCNFLTFYIFALIIFLVVIGLIVIINLSDQQTAVGILIKTIMVKSDSIKIIYICVAFILTIVLMFLLILFLVQYAVKSEISITEVMDYCGTGIKTKNKIHPKMNDDKKNAIPIPF